MKQAISRVEARALRVPVDFTAYGDRPGRTNTMCLVEIETDQGLVGHGLTSITQAPVIETMVNKVAGPAVTGMDAFAIERVWQELYWLLTPWAQSGHPGHAISAIDLALWDIRGKALGEPVWRLLGGARERVEAYATCGFAFFDVDNLVAVSQDYVAKGFRALKFQVGRPGLDRRDSDAPLGPALAEDVRRLAAVREAVGPDIELSVDAGCRLDLLHAVELARALEPVGIACFEEPIMQNDVRLLADMRRRTTIPLSAGQNEGQAYRFRDMLLAGAVDILQPNVIISGGITQCAKIAGMAQAFNVPISNGGGCPYHNAHLQAGVANGTAIEYQLNSAGACEVIFSGLPEIVDGWLAMSETPGLGFAPDPDAVRDCAMA